MRAARRSLFRVASAALPVYAPPVLEVLEGRRLLSATGSHAPAQLAGAYSGNLKVKGPNHSRATETLRLNVQGETADGHLTGLLDLGADAGIPFTGVVIGRKLAVTFSGAADGLLIGRVGGGG